MQPFLSLFLDHLPLPFHFESFFGSGVGHERGLPISDRAVNLTVRSFDLILLNANNSNINVDLPIVKLHLRSVWDGLY